MTAKAKGAALSSSKGKKRAKKRSAPTRKPGAQPGNKNALRHGFYSKRFTSDESKRLDETDKIDVQSEIALLRVCIDRLTNELDFAENWLIDQQGNQTRDDHYLKALNTLAVMTGSLSTLTRTHYLIRGRAGDVSDSILRALEELRIEMGIWRKMRTKRITPARPAAVSFGAGERLVVVERRIRKMIITFFLYANYDHAGTNKFKHHILEEKADRTLCGLRLKELRGQWEFDDFQPDNIGCLRCKKTYESRLLRQKFSVAVEAVPSFTATPIT